MAGLARRRSRIVLRVADLAAFAGPTSSVTIDVSVLDRRDAM
jgi:hypothetical protein